LNYRQDQKIITEAEPYHHQLVTIVKDYMEIIFMSFILALLMLKKKLLYDCLITKMHGNKYEPPLDPEMQLRQID